MPGRKSLVYSLWLLSLLALLAWVQLEPTRKSGLATVSSRPDYHLNHFDPTKAKPTAYLRAGMADDADLEGSALACEDEEQDRVDVPNEPRVSLLVSCSFRKAAARPVISPPSILSHYPIRC